jgi:hypothetical protein
VSFDHAILNLVNWVGNVIMPTLAAVFVITAILEFSKGRDFSHSLYGILGCLTISGLTRVFENIADQQTFNSPDRYWLSVVTLVNWFANVIMPVYAAGQVALGAMRLSIYSYIHPTSGWLRHFAAAAMCLLISGLLRLAEFFVVQGTAGVT